MCFLFCKQNTAYDMRISDWSSDVCSSDLITHAAFKVALLTFCRSRGLPHPGFLVLDTPLITYRDPIRSRAGALEADEAVIKQSDLKERMFEHIGSLSELGQFIIFDNADPPQGAERVAVLQTLTHDNRQRVA